MKKEVSQAVVVVAIVVIVLATAFFGWKMLADGNPSRESPSAGAIKPDASPDTSGARPVPPKRGNSLHQ